MKSVITLEFESEQDMFNFLGRLKHFLPVASGDPVPERRELIPPPTTARVTADEIKSGNGDMAECANPKCRKLFHPKRGGTTCSKQCSVQAAYYKKKVKAAVGRS